MLLVDRLKYPNFVPPAFDVRLAAQRVSDGEMPPLGQYAYAWEEGGEIVVLRDPIGSNKLFFGRSATGGVVVASRIVDALAEGVALDDLGSCPPGHVLRLRDGGVVDDQGGDLSIMPADPDFDLAEFRREVAVQLGSFFRSLGQTWPEEEFVVCLSGGLDSSIIASLAKTHLNHVTAATFSYLEPDEMDLWRRTGDSDAVTGVSEDFRSAREIARVLDLTFLPVFRTRDAVDEAVDEAVRLCQDWRDFNVHCAVVNLFLAQSIRERFGPNGATVLTGDLMNEFVCDYKEEVFDGKTYYPQPRMALAKRRRFFVSGLDAGDRELGLFNGHDLKVVQPFVVVADAYMRVPASILEEADAKMRLNAHLLPKAVLDKVGQAKQRAQVGGKDGGTLGIFHNLGLDQDQLMALWRSTLPSEAIGERPHDIIQFGRYRNCPKMS